MTKEEIEKIFEAGLNFAAEKYGSTHGQFGLKMTNPDFEEWYKAFVSNESKPLDVEGLRGKFQKQFGVHDTMCLRHNKGHEIFDWFLSELANIKQGDGKETTHDKFRKNLSDVFDKWNEQFGNRKYCKMGNQEHFYFVRFEGNLNPNSTHSYESVVKLFEQSVLNPAVVSPLVNTELNKCSCLKCGPNEYPNLRFNVCSICGNKRCPHAEDHNFKCTNSNDVGQPKQPVVNTLPTDEEIKKALDEMNKQPLTFVPDKQGEDTKSEWISVEAVEKLNPGDIFLWKSGMNGNYEIHQFHSAAGYGAKTFTNYNEKDGSSMLVNYSGICGILVPKSPTI